MDGLNSGDFWVFLVPIVAIAAWALLAVVSTVTRSRVRELEVRERIAMIEKGIVPPPELDPRGFDRAMQRHDRHDRPFRSRPYRHYRHRSAGVTLIFVGLGLMVLMFPNARVGGFLMVVGVGFFINSLLFERTPPVDPPPQP